MDTPWGPGQPLVCAPALTQVSRVWHQLVKVKGQKDMALGQGWKSGSWFRGQGIGSSLCISCQQPGKMLPLFTVTHADHSGPKGTRGTGKQDSRGPECP